MKVEVKLKGKCDVPVVIPQLTPNQTPTEILSSHHGLFTRVFRAKALGIISKAISVFV